MRVLKRAVIREEYVELTGDLESAIILNQFIYWSERIRDFDKFIEEERNIREKAGLTTDCEKINGWIYKDLEELKEEIMFTCSTKTISRKVNLLIDNGWLDKRNNPNFKWDRRLQYRVNLFKICSDLYKIGYLLQDYKIDLNMLEFSNGQIVQCNGQDEKQDNGQDNDDYNKDDEMLKNSKRQNVPSNGQFDLSKGQSVSSNGQNDGALSEITSETTTEITSSINQADKNRLIEIDKKIKSKGFKSYKDLVHEVVLPKENYEYPYSEWVDTAKHSIWQMYYFDETSIGGRRIASFDVITKLQGLSFDMVYAAIRNVVDMSKSQEIRYPVAFLKTALFNEIDEFGARTNAQVNYDLNNDME